MLRSCLLSLLLYAALAVGYYFWLSTVFEPPTSYWASALVGFIVLCSLGALINARNAYRDWSLLSAGRRGLPPRDGRLIAVSGTIHPIGAPLIAPFSGVECVLCEYDLAQTKRQAVPPGNENTGSVFTGFLMIPCVVRSAGGDIKLLGFPVLDGFVEGWHSSYAAARRAIDFLTTREFEDRTGLKMVTVLSVFGDVWSDEDGLVEKNIRLGKVTLPDLFPPELEAEIDRQLALELERANSTTTEDSDDELDDEEEDDDDDYDEDDSLDDEIESRGAAVNIPKLTEKRVDVGEQVCAIGRYNEVRGGLLPARGSGAPNRLVLGSAEQLETKSRRSIVSHLLGGLVMLLIVHGATYGIMQAYLNSAEMAKHRQTEAFKAVEEGNLARLERLVRRGMSVDIRGHSQETPLMVAKDAAIATWLIRHGADVNATDNDGETPLIKAAESGRADMVQLLIDAKADLNRRSTSYQRTALMTAVDGDRSEVATLLRQAGAEDDVITANTGRPLPTDGGPQLAVCRAYLQAVRDRDPAALRALFAQSTTYGFESVDWELWHRVRPAQIESWTGYVRGDNASISLTGQSGAGYPVTWNYQLRQVDGQWKIARERQDYGGQ